MKIFEGKYIHFILAFICIALVYFIFKWIDFLVQYNYVVECFESRDHSDQPINPENVNLPLTTSYSCRNFCGPTARCSITGQQCIADIDCPGCEPYQPPLSKVKGIIPGQNDAGKITGGVTPQYSTLTTDIGTQAAFVNGDPLRPPPKANFGINTWLSPFHKSRQLFDKRYKPHHNLQFEINYPERHTTTGLFVSNEPLASNAYITFQK